MRQLKKELWPCRVKLDVNDTMTKIDDVEYWLGEQFGQFKKDWNAVYFSNYTDFYFRNESDATFFALKWS